MALSHQALTSRQLMVLNFIRRYTQENGYAPTIRETGEGTGLSSSSTVKYHFDALMTLGLIAADPRRPRTVMLTPEGRSVDPDTGEMLPARPEPTETVDIPLVGRIAAGSPILADQLVEDVFTFPRQVTGNGELFMLEVQGDSMMDAGILNGDWVVVRREQSAEPGQIVAALIEDEATVKEFAIRDGGVWLLPHNDAYEPIPANHASILGRVVTVIRSL